MEQTRELWRVDSILELSVRVRESYERELSSIYRRIPFADRVVLSVPGDVNSSGGGTAMILPMGNAANCVALFGMWYDLDSQNFFLTKADEVDGIYLFSMRSFVQDVIGIPEPPSNINDLIMEYKATGKLKALLDGIHTAGVDPYQGVEYGASYLRYLLMEEAKSYTVERKNYTERREALVEVMGAVVRLESVLRRYDSLGRPDAKMQSPRFRNILTTTLAVRWVSSGATYDFAQSDEEIYSNSAAGVAYSHLRGITAIKARQMQEILVAETLLDNDFYFTEGVDPRTSPTMMRVDGRERNAAVNAYENSGKDFATSSHANAGVSALLVELFMKRFRLIGRVARFALTVVPPK